MSSHNPNSVFVDADDLTALNPISPMKGEAQSLSEEPILHGQFGRYVIERELGRGGMGAVYLALDSNLDRKVAIKVPFFRAEDGPEVIERFYREARAMAKVQHPNLCAIYDVGQIENRHFLSMAYIEGPTLQRRLQSSPRLTERESAEFIRKVALALHKAHLANVVHRDLKPGNILIGPDREPVVTDFGLARIIKPGEVELTTQGTIMGSAAYMAPEQVEGKVDEIGPPSDIWAMGVILYQMLTGVRPFEGSTAAILGRILSSDPVPPSKIETISWELEAICMKAISKPADKRFKSALELANALDHFLGGSSSSDVSESTCLFVNDVAETLSNSGRRHREAERRQVTIAVFSHDSDDVAETDPEVHREIAAEFARFVDSVVAPLGGGHHPVNRSRGPGLLWFSKRLRRRFIARRSGRPADLEKQYISVWIHPATYTNENVGCHPCR